MLREGTLLALMPHAIKTVPNKLEILFKCPWMIPVICKLKAEDAIEPNTMASKSIHAPSQLPRFVITTNFSGFHWNFIDQHKVKQEQLCFLFYISHK